MNAARQRSTASPILDPYWIYVYSQTTMPATVIEMHHNGLRSAGKRNAAAAGIDAESRIHRCRQKASSPLEPATPLPAPVTVQNLHEAFLNFESLQGCSPDVISELKLSKGCRTREYCDWSQDAEMIQLCLE